MITYKNWNLLTSQELNRITVDYVDPEGQCYSAPFCFYSLEEALEYGKLCIDQSLRARGLIQKGQSAEELEKRVIS